MKKRQVILGLKSPSDFTYEEIKMIIEKYLQTSKKRIFGENIQGKVKKKDIY